MSYFFVFRFISVEVSDRNQNDFIQLFHFSDFLFLVSIIFMYIYKERIIEGQIFYTGLIVSFMIVSYKKWSESKGMWLWDEDFLSLFYIVFHTSVIFFLE